jgi:virginiamycin A acetyltransferase
MALKQVIKRAVQGCCLVLVAPAALLCAFGHITPLYVLFAQAFSLVPDPIGMFVRAAYYKYTLRECSIDTSIAFASFISNRNARIGANVSIGSFCVIGRVKIGARTQISSLVQIPSGRHQHHHDENGQLIGSQFQEVEIASDCWIGASAVIMAKVGEGSTIGAGSVVVNDIPAGVVAAGVPAKPLRSRSSQSSKSADMVEAR